MKKIFIEAHKMTREMVKEYGVDYQAQFGLCLSYLLEGRGDGKEMISIEKLEEMISKRDNTKTDITINEWKKHDKHRIYINVSIKTANKKITSFIDLKEDEVVTTHNDNSNWIEKTTAIVQELVEEYREEIIELVVNKEEKEEKAEIKTSNKEAVRSNDDIDLHAEFLGIDNNLSNEDFEDITGLKKFDEDYF